MNKSSFDAIWIVATCLAVAFITWKTYPIFWSRYKRATTSTAGYFTKRLVQSILLGFIVTPIIIVTILNSIKEGAQNIQLQNNTTTKNAITSKPPQSTSIASTASSENIVNPATITPNQESNTANNQGDAHQNDIEPTNSLTKITPTVTSTVVQWSPSFDCTKVATGAERLICSSRELSEADVQMAQAYRAAAATAVDKTDLRAAQIQWRKTERDACVDIQCMLSAYENRINALRH